MYYPRACVALVQVTQHAVASGDEATAVVAFETFLDLLEVPASWMGPFFPALVKLSLQTASNTHLELNTREQALQVLHHHHLTTLSLLPCHSLLSLLYWHLLLLSSLSAHLLLLLL